MQQHPPNLPAGETLPEYDDEQHADAYAIQDFLRQRLPDRWGPESLHPGAVSADAMRAVGLYERTLITDVIGALLTVADATLVKNPTYRAMVRDGREMERLAAGLSRLGLTDQVVTADGNPVTAALQALRLGLRPDLTRAVVHATPGTPAVGA